MCEVSDILRMSWMSWNGRYGGCVVNVVSSGLRSLAAIGGKYGLDTVCSSKTQTTMNVSHRQYFPHSRYPNFPRMYMKMAPAP